MEKNREQPKIIPLSELPFEGRQYLYTTAGGELTADLQDLLKGKDYEVALKVAPYGNIFKVEGHVKTQLDTICSRCALDLELPLNIEFNELLMIDDTEYRKNGSQSHSHFSMEFSEDQAFCQYIETDKFDVGAFVHEIIAINEPVRPLKSPDCEVTCENFDRAVENGWVAKEETTVKKSPFDVLKDIKLNS